MSVEEAEEVVERLGEGGMLSLERGVIDGTTEEGREKLRRLELEARQGGAGDLAEDEEARFEEVDDDKHGEGGVEKVLEQEKGKTAQNPLLVSDPD